MATANFNSMPANYSDGKRDKSVPDPILTTKQYPTHLPLWFIYAQKGPTGRVLADGAIREQLFGAKTFEVGSKYFTHQTQFANAVNTYQQSIYQRVHSPSAKKAGIRIWIDVLKTRVPEYEVGIDGKPILDSAGYPVETGNTIEGYSLKFVKTAIGANNTGDFGTASQMTGNQVDTVLGTQSIRYPFLDLPVTHVGSYGDDMGFRMWAPHTSSRMVVDEDIVEKNRAFPYIFAVLDKSNDAIQNVQTVMGVQEVTAVFKRNQVKRSVGNMPISFEPRFFESWNDRERFGMAPLYGPFDEPHLYYENLVHVLKQFYDAEQPYFNMFSDFDGSGYTDDDEGEIHLFNFVSGKSSKGVPYRSFVVNRDDVDSESVSEISSMWAEGGSDGEMDIDTFNRLVQAEITKYGDINNEVAEDRLGNPESIFYDSGFDIDCKMAMVNFIAVRKDNYLSWCLTDASGRTLTAEEESSMAIALFTRGQMMPESAEYGTPACRFEIIACDGKLISSQNTTRLPLNLEIAVKSARYMGAGNGLWKSEFAFSHGRYAEVSMFRDVNVIWRPIVARARDWSNGMVYVQKKDMDKLFFPALRTGYAIDQSVFTSRFNVLIAVDLEKVADRVWANYSGADGYTNEQFKKYVEQDFKNQIEGKYDDRVDIRPYVTFSAVDEFNGYSWTLNVDMGMENMKTVQFTILTGYRRESMPAIS